MARKARDYKAEYAKRLSRERERATREGREFSRHAARGHKSREHESEQRKRIRTRRRLLGVLSPELVETARGSIPRPKWHDLLDDTIRVLGEASTALLLIDKVNAMVEYVREGSGKDIGKRLWKRRERYYKTPDGDEFLPVEMFYYHDSPN